MDPLALIGFGLMALGILGPAGSARAREASLRSGLQAVQMGLQYQLSQKELAQQRELREKELGLREKALGLEERELKLREKALQFEITRAKAMYNAILKAGQAGLGQETVDELVNNLETELQKLQSETQTEVQTGPQLEPQTLAPIPEPKLNPQMPKDVGFKKLKSNLLEFSSIMYSMALSGFSIVNPPLAKAIEEFRRRNFNGRTPSN